jgi:uncharacterized membrane protein
MLSKWQWLLRQLTRTLWLRASLFALLAITTALIAIPAERFLPEALPYQLGTESLGQILNILASSMLAVTTFSLSVMVSAYSAASSTATPRATQLVKSDTTSQNVLATFIGSFLFSLVAIIALSTGIYGENGRLILFMVTIAVIVIIVITMLRWIEHLSQLGRLTSTTTRIEEAASTAIKERIQFPYLGANSLDPEAESHYIDNVVNAQCTGYIQHIDLRLLNNLAKKHACELTILAEAGQLVHPAYPLLCFEGELDAELENQLCAAFSINNQRSFDQDPRFGISVLAEIASRALSPAVNDPGTAIDIISRSVRLFEPWREQNLSVNEDELLYPHIKVRPLSLSDLFDDIYLPIARDGAALIEVQIQLQKALLALKQIDHDCFCTEAERVSQIALEYGLQSLITEHDKQRLMRIADRIKTPQNAFRG